MSLTITWAVSGHTGTWAADGTIPSPRGASFNEPVASTFEEVSLADGSKAVVIPETKYTSSSVRFFWQKAPSSLKSKLEGYLKAGTGLKFATHIPGKTFEGYLTTVDSEWIPGTSLEQYNISADFMIRTVA